MSVFFFCRRCIRGDTAKAKAKAKATTYCRQQLEQLERVWNECGWMWMDVDSIKVNTYASTPIRTKDKNNSQTQERIPTCLKNHTHAYTRTHTHKLCACGFVWFDPYTHASCVCVCLVRGSKKKNVWCVAPSVARPKLVRRDGPIAPNDLGPSDLAPSDLAPSDLPLRNGLIRNGPFAVFARGTTACMRGGCLGSVVPKIFYSF